MERTLRRLMVSMPLLASLGAQAMSIGEIDVTSHLGEPLRAKVPIRLDDEVLPDNQCARIAGPARHHPDLSTARVSLENRGGRHFIVIDTDRPVGDPMLDLTLLVEGCGPSMRKDFVILLSPKDIETTTAPVAGPVPPSVARFESAPPPARIPIRTPARPKTKPVAKAKPAAKPAAGKPPVRAATVPTRRYALTLDYDHSGFGQLAERIVQRKQAAYRASVKDGQTAAIAPKTKELPAKTPAKSSVPKPAAPEAKPIQDNRLILRPPPADLLPPLPGAVDAPTAGQAAEGTLSATGLSPALTEPSRGAVAVPIDADTAKPWYAWLADNYNLLVPLLLVLLALAVALWLKLRRPPSRFLDKTAPDLQSLFPASPEESMPLHSTMRDLPSADEVFVEPSEAKTLLSEGLAPRPLSQGIETLEFPRGEGAKSRQAEDFTVEQHDTFDHVMELAEVMLAFGRSGQAIDALSHHIRENPRQSLDPWLKLLDLYHQSNLRTEFEALASDLHKCYNVAIIEWADYAASSGAAPTDGPLTLESLPHVMNRLIECWGTQAALDYVDKVLADNRGGQRLGFSMPIVRDILLLRDILRQTCAVSASSI